MGKLYVVGIGPGSEDGMTIRARKITEFMSRYGLGFIEKGYGPYTDSLLFFNSRSYGALFDHSKVKVDTIIEDMLNK